MATEITGYGVGTNCRLETDDPSVEGYLAGLPALGAGFGIAAATKLDDGVWEITPQAARYVKENFIPRHHTATWSA